MRRSTAALAAFFTVGLLFAWAQSRLFTGGQSFEFCHYGEIGRRIAGGEGYRTGVFYPAELAILAQRRAAPTSGSGPVLSRFPLHAVLVGLSIKLFGNRDGAVLAVQGFELATAAAVAAFVFFPLAGGWGALGAALLFALSPSMLRGFALWGYPDLLFAALLLALNGAWFSKYSPRLLGALAGFCWLARPNFILLLPVYLWLGWKREKKNEETFLFYGRAAIAALIVIFPFAVYQLFHAGRLLNPNFLWNLVDGIVVERPGWHYFRVFSYGDLGWASLGAIALKGGRGLGSILLSIPTLWQMSLLLPFAGWGLYKDKTSREWFQLNGLLLAVHVLGFAFLRQEDLGAASGRYYLWFAPTLTLAAVAGARALHRRALPGMAAAAFLWFGFFYLQGDPGFGHPAGLPRNWPEIRAIREIDNDTFVATNIPAHLGWYAKKRAVLVPDTEEEFEGLLKIIPIGAIHLSTLRVGELPVLPFWLGLLKDKAAADAFCRRHGFRIERAEPTGLLLVRG